MDTLVYILQVNIGIVLFYLGYVLFLKNETHFQLKRWYLLGGLVLPVLIPLIDFSNSVYQVVKPISLAVFEVGTGTGTEATSSWSVLQVVLFAIGIGMVIVLSKLAIALVRVIKLIAKGKHLKQEGVSIVLVDDQQPPASFFNYVFLPESKLKEDDEVLSIIAHERVHVQQMHSIDVLLAEIAKAFFWFNPAIYLYKRSIEENHEFIADNTVINHHINLQQYTNILLGQALGVAPLVLTNSFINQSLLKRRIKMIHKAKSKKWAQIKYVVILPVMAAAVLFKACTKNELPEENTAEATTEQVYTEVDHMPEFPGGQEKLMAYLGSNIKYPEEAKKGGIEGTVYVNFVVDKNGKVTQAKVLKGVNKALDAQAKDVVASMPDWSPGKQKGKEVAVSYNLPIRYALN